MAQLYSNENFPLPAVEELRKLGHDVLTSLDAGQANRSIPDREVLLYAQGQNRILLTLNRKHFLRLHNELPGHSGIIACTFDPDFEGQAQRIHEVLQTNTSPNGRFIRINRPG